MRRFHSNPDLEQEQEHHKSSSQKASESIPLHMLDNLPARQGRQIRRKIAKKLAPHLGNKVFTRQYVQRQEEEDERPDVVIPPDFPGHMANASAQANATRTKAETVQESAQEYSAISGALVGVEGMKVMPPELTALGKKMRTGVDAIPQSNTNTNNAMEAARASFIAANPDL